MGAEAGTKGNVTLKVAALLHRASPTMTTIEPCKSVKVETRQTGNERCESADGIPPLSRTLRGPGSYREGWIDGAAGLTGAADTHR